MTSELREESVRLAIEKNRGVGGWGGRAEQIDEASRASNTEVSMNLVLGWQDPSPGA